MGRKKFYWPALGALTVFFVVALAMVAVADNVKNDVVAGGTDTITAGGSTTIHYYIQNTSAGGSGFSGCDASDGSSATVTVNAPAGVTASPSSLTFTSCDTQQGVAFSSSTVGDHAITVSVTDSHGNYNPNGAAFTLHVLPVVVTNDPPSLTLPTSMLVEGNTLGGANVTYTGISASDNQDGDLTSEVTCNPTSGSFFALGGPWLVECSVTDHDATPLTTSGFFYVTVEDTTAPVIAPHGDETAEATSSAGALVSYTAPSTSDVVDGPGTATCAPASGTTFALGDSTVTCNASDTAGNAATATFTVHVVDTTPPTITFVSALPAPNGAGWNNSNVTVTWDCSDLVGVTSPTVTAIISTEGSNESATGTCEDTSGNQASDTHSGIKLDKTNPTLTWNGGPADGATYVLGSVPTAPTCTAADTLSGPNGCDVTGYGAGIGSHTMTATAHDVAGNSKIETRTYNVIYDWTGFFQPVDNKDASGNWIFNVAKAGSAIPVKFNLGGNQGLSILKDGYPKSTKVDCSSATDLDNIEVTVTAGGSSLNYDAAANQYIYVWKTDKTWGGTCRMFDLGLNDGTTHVAYFKFTK